MPRHAAPAAQHSPLSKCLIIATVLVTMIAMLAVAGFSAWGSLLMLSHEHMHLSGTVYFTPSDHPGSSTIAFVVGIVGGPAYWGIGLLAIDRVLTGKD
jgi:hypothetical protein